MKKMKSLKIACFAVAVAIALFTGKAYTQSKPSIIIDGNYVLASGDAKLPSWLNAGSTLEAGNKVVFISVLQYNIAAAVAGGNDLQFDSVIKVSVQKTVPVNKAWKIESVAFDTTVISGNGDNWGSQAAMTNSTLAGDGTYSSKLDIAQQGASSGQVLQWNGTTWIPATVAGDNLGNHTATQALNMNSYKINNLANPDTLGDAVNAVSLQNGALIYNNDIGAADAYAVTLSPVPAAYSPGMMVSFKAANANTGTSTLNVNALGDVTIKKQVTANLAANDILVNQVVTVIFDGTNFQMLGQTGAGGGSSCTSIELADAGADISAINGDTASLAGNTPDVSTGLWSIVSGSGGNIINPTSPSATFTGTDNTTYKLKWTLSSAGCPSVSDEVMVTFAVANYANGNLAYWTEKSNSYRPVRIGTDTVVFYYDATNKMYKNVAATLILLPTISRLGSAQPETVSASSFFGYSGGSANNNNFQWDSQATLPGNTYDVDKVFVSPVSAAMNYCKALQNSYTGACNNSESSITYATTTFCYPTTPNTKGPHTVWTGGDLVPYTVTGSFGNRRYSQQSMDGDGYNDSYCVATYGKGWRIPTDIEIGRPNNLNDNGNPALNTGYLGTTNVQMWSSTIACQSGGGTCYNEYRMPWRLDNSSHTWPWSAGMPQVDSSHPVRCIYTEGY